MQDRNLHDRKRSRRKKRLKQRRRSLLFRRVFVLVAILAILYLLVTFAMSKFSNKKPKVADDKEVKLSLEDDTQLEAKKGPAVNTNITFDMMKEDMDKRVDSFIKSNKIAKDNFAIGYFNLATDEAYSYNGGKEFYVGGSNNFMIAMDVYDLALEKNIDLDEEFEISSQNDEGEAKLNNKFTLRELVKLMVTQQNEEAKDQLIAFIEEKSSKNWYDELSKRYGVNLTYTNQISAQDCLKILRRLFSERRMTAEERIKANDDKTTVLAYQELVNFMSSNMSSSALINGLAKKSQVSGNFGNQYDDNSLMGYVLGEKKYLYVVMSSKADKQRVFDGLNVLDQWFDYYHK